MKAAVVTSFHSPLELQELPIPQPEPGRTCVVIADRKLDDVNQSIADVLSGHIEARVVFPL